MDRTRKAYPHHIQATNSFRGLVAFFLRYRYILPILESANCVQIITIDRCMNPETVSPHVTFGQIQHPYAEIFWMKERDRNSILSRGYDYTNAGYYFVTICVKERECLSGNVIDDVQLPKTGEVAEKCWLEIPAHFPHVSNTNYEEIFPLTRICR